MGTDDMKKKIKSNMNKMKSNAFITSRSNKSARPPEDEKTKTVSDALKVDDGTKSEGKADLEEVEDAKEIEDDDEK